MMPEMDGIEVCEKIREKQRYDDILILFLTARSEDYSELAGFSAGADDYITKPFSPNELIARLRAVNRRHSINKTITETKLDDLELLPNQSKISVGNKNIYLTEVECHIIHFLLNATDHFLSREDLYIKVFKREMLPDDRSLDVHISNLRRKLGPHPKKGNRIRAVRGKGYTLTK